MILALIRFVSSAAVHCIGKVITQKEKIKPKKATDNFVIFKRLIRNVLKMNRHLLNLVLIVLWTKR